jgi:predicted nucleotidyltransferase
MKVMRKFRDRDFLQTKEGFFFCVVGSLHPPDCVISYLKYVPAKLGLWGKGKQRFKRVMRAYTIPNLLETFSFLERNYPQYLFHSPFYNIIMTAVPREYLMKHYKPEEKLARLLQTSRLDPLQKKLTRFTSFLAETSEVPPKFFGVTGSILLDIHRPEFSDMDITVYGLKNSLVVREALTKSYSSASSSVKRLEGKSLKAWCESKSQRYPLTPDEALRIYERKWNFGFFEGTPFSIHPVKLEEEIHEEYGDKTYHPMGSATVRAVVYENSDCLFLPSVYRLREVDIVEGPQVSDVEEVVSYESLYDNLAEVGESVVAKGKLESVVDRKTGREYHRILVGSPEGKGMEYVKLFGHKLL